MKLLITLLVTLLCVNAYLATSQTLRSTCTVSGDPHIWMLDGVGVHFQGRGTFTVVNSLPVEVQTTTRRWGMAVTAMRSTTVRLRSQLNARVAYNTIIGWGSWGGTSALGAFRSYPAQPRLLGAIDNVVISTPSIIGIATNAGARAFDVSQCAMTESNSINTYTCPYSALVNKDVFINNREYKINVGTNLRAPSVQVIQQNVKFPIEVRINYWTNLAVSLPNTNDIISKTNGLCGFWDGISSTEFIDSNNTNLVTATPIYSGRWYQSATTEQWGNTYAVPAGNILLPNYLATVAGADEDIYNTAVADADTVDMLDKISFKSLSELNAAQDMCAQQVPATKQEFVAPCVFDLAIASAENENGVVDANGFAPLSEMASNAYEVAMSNVLAAQQIAETENENSGTNGVLIGIGIAGGVAVVALVSLVVITIKLRRTKESMELSSATVSVSMT